VTVRETPAGGLSAVDRHGAELLSAARPTMWDSTSAAPAGAPHPQTGADATSISGPAEGDEVAAMDLAVDASAVRITPEPRLLTSPETTFPLFIDPAMNAGRTQWAMVNASYPGTSYYKWSNGSDTRGEGMGYVSTAADGTHTKRLFYAFDTGALRVSGRTIVSATFRAFQTWSANCTSAGVEAWLTNPISSGTTWNRQPTWVGPHTARTAPKYGRPECTPGGAWVDFNVKNQVIASQLKSWTVTTIGLKATSETTNTSWRRFRNDATLEVEYNTYPNVPTSAQMLSPTTSCGSSVPRADMPIMQVKVTDPDGTQNQVRARFQIFRSGESTPRYTYTTSPGASGATFRQQMPALTDGFWTWRALAVDAGNLESGWTGLCNVNVDGTAPTPPSIWYNGGQLTVGGDLDFQFTGGSADVVSYRYAVNGDAPTSSAISVWDGKAKIRLTSFGPFTLRVWGYDAAGNRGSSASWPPEDPLIIGGADALDWWRMNDAGGSTAANVRRPTNDLLLQGAAGWEPDAWADTGTSLALGSGAFGAGIGAGGPADGGHFTVSAWLKLGASSGTGKRVVVSQDFGMNAAYSLAVENTAGPTTPGATPEVADRVVATLYRPDGSVGLRVPSSLALEPGRWVHAAMERINEPDGTVALELWVTDSAAGETLANASDQSVSASTLVSSPPGYTRVGAEARNGNAANHFVGAIDEVVTAKGPFDDQQLAYWRKPVQ
jgi:hypothetical protein